LASTALVNLDIEDGEKVVRALDAAGKSPNVALWAKLPDYEDWRMVIASEHLDQNSQFAAYNDINDAIQKAGVPFYRQPSILLRPMKNPMIEDMRSAYASFEETYGMRLGGRTFGDKFLEDAFVYRIR
jgi:hypothetical protein